MGSNEERRRYFRIQETVGISWQMLDGREEGLEGQSLDIFSLMSEQDQRIELLLDELSSENPKVAELVGLFNQKLERVVSQLILDSNLVSRIAHKVKEANISACGIAFLHDEYIPLGASLRLELTLFPAQQKLITDGRVVACDASNNEQYYWRVDFYGMSKADQEALIQHIVRSQSQQLKTIRQT